MKVIKNAQKISNSQEKGIKWIGCCVVGANECQCPPPKPKK